MTLRSSPALMQALALLRAPRSARPGPGDRLPEGVELLLRIVGGDANAMALAVQRTKEAEATVRDAAVFYIQQVLFAKDSDSYRVLGLDPGATDEQLKSHQRWLTRWLHPDRNRDEWEAIYSERVNRAWQDLRTAERRQRYDQGRAGSAAPVQVGRGMNIGGGRPLHLDDPAPGPSLRWLPHAILGGLGLSALAIVALYYILRFAGPSPELSEAQPEVDGDFASSALANPRLARGGAQALAAAVTPAPAATSAIEPAVRPSSPAPSMALAKIDPRAVQPVPSAPPPVAMKPASVPAVEPVAARSGPPKPVQMEASPGEVTPQVENRLPPPAPTPIAKEQVREAPRAAPVSQGEADRIVGRFSGVYADGDLAGMRAMFTPDATSPDGGLDAILGEYGRLFERSKQRRLAVRDVNWSASGKTFTVVASYEATVKTGLLSRTRSQGKLRFEMRQVDDQWRIYRLEHNERND